MVNVGIKSCCWRAFADETVIWLEAYYLTAKGLSVSIKIRADMRQILHMKQRHRHVSNEGRTIEWYIRLTDRRRGLFNERQIIDVCVISSSKVVSFILMIKGQSDWGFQMRTTGIGHQPLTKTKISEGSWIRTQYFDLIVENISLTCICRSRQLFDPHQFTVVSTLNAKYFIT